MIIKKSVLAATVAFALCCSNMQLIAQDPVPGPTWSQEDSLRIVKDIQKKLGRLTYFSVFDWITVGSRGKTVVLRGYASRPLLKSEAESAIKNIPGIEKVDNQIEVLPNSMNDDRIRAAVYNRLFTHPSLRKYNANAGTLGQAMGPGGRMMGPGPSTTMMAGGITNSPPIGYHAIHIIVKNGNVTLFGAVINDSDSAIAEIQANSTPGAFSIDNNLVVEQRPAKAPAKAK
jgi:hyperosmotically inducible protein